MATGGRADRTTGVPLFGVFVYGRRRWESIPEFFAVPIDPWMRFYFHVAFDHGLAGQSHLFVWIREDFERQERVEPLPESFKDSLSRNVFFALADDNVAAAASPHSQAVHNLVWTGIQLHSVFAGDRSEIFAFCGIDGNLFVDKLDFGHGTGLSSTGSGKELRKERGC